MSGHYQSSMELEPDMPFEEAMKRLLEEPSFQQEPFQMNDLQGPSFSGQESQTEGFQSMLDEPIQWQPSQQPVFHQPAFQQRVLQRPAFHQQAIPQQATVQRPLDPFLCSDLVDRVIMETGAMPTARVGGLPQQAIFNNRFQRVPAQSAGPWTYTPEAHLPMRQSFVPPVPDFGTSIPIPMTQTPAFASLDPRFIQADQTMVQRFPAFVPSDPAFTLSDPEPLPSGPLFMPMDQAPMLPALAPVPTPMDLGPNDMMGPYPPPYPGQFSQPPAYMPAAPDNGPDPTKPMSPLPGLTRREGEPQQPRVTRRRTRTRTPLPQPQEQSQEKLQEQQEQQPQKQLPEAEDGAEAVVDQLTQAEQAEEAEQPQPSQTVQPDFGIEEMRVSLLLLPDTTAFNATFSETFNGTLDSLMLDGKERQEVNELFGETSDGPFDSPMLDDQERQEVNELFGETSDGSFDSSMLDDQEKQEVDALFGETPDGSFDYSMMGGMKMPKVTPSESDGRDSRKPSSSSESDGREARAAVSKVARPSRQGKRIGKHSCDRCKKDKKKCIAGEGFNCCEYCWLKGVPCNRTSSDRREKGAH